MGAAVVFVCGMIERHFPQYHREDPLLGDAGRRRAGLKTSSDLQREERSLFDLAVTRATEQVILSYPRFDETARRRCPPCFSRIWRSRLSRCGCARDPPAPPPHCLTQK